MSNAGVWGQENPLQGIDLEQHNDILVSWCHSLTKVACCLPESIGRLGKNSPTGSGGAHWRRMMLSGLRAAMLNLKGAGCQTIYVDGSFVTSKEVPNDYDACWNEAGVDPTTLDRVLLMTSIPGRDIQKARYLGEFLPRVRNGRGGRIIVSGVLSEGQGDRETKRGCRHGLGRVAMIKNERQYRITKAQVARFGEARDTLSRRPNPNGPAPANREGARGCGQRPVWRRWRTSYASTNR